MAAPCRLCGVLRLGYQLGQAERHAWITSHQFQQLRFKKANRSKPPSVYVAKETPWSIRIKKKVPIIQVKKIDLKPFAEDDVWIEKYYDPIKYDLVSAIQMHREACQPAMLNAPSARLKLTLKLDLRTKKKTKFMHVIKRTIALPHNFEDGIANRVMVFVKDEGGKNIAQELGAAFVGGVDLVKMIDKGEVRHDDFDHVVCHVDMMQEISVVRKFLRDAFPSIKNGNLGGDMEKMVSFFVSGTTYESLKLEDAVGKMDVTLGTLDMPDEQLIANHDAYIEAICSHRSESLGPFITEGSLTCPPSREAFPISSSLLRPLSQRDSEVTVLEQEEEESPKVNEDEGSDDEQPQIAKKAK